MVSRRKSPLARYLHHQDFFTPRNLNLAQLEKEKFLLAWEIILALCDYLCIRCQAFFSPLHSVFS